MPLSVSVVIGASERTPFLARVLGSLAQLRHPAFEAIVVAGLADPETDEILRAHRGHVRVARAATANRAELRNLGLAIARGDLVCFLDTDAVPEPNWLEHLEAAFHDPSVGAAGACVPDQTGANSDGKVALCDRLGNVHLYASIDEARAAEGTDRYLLLSGTNCAFRRRVLRQLGGWDGACSSFLGEADLLLRLVEAGHRIEYTPAARVHGGVATRHLAPDVWVRNVAYFSLKHRRDLTPVDGMFSRLRRYADGFRPEQRQWLESGEIDRVEHDRRLELVELGLTEGVADAFAPRPPVRRPHGPAGAFKPFTAGRPVRERLRLCFLTQEYPPAPCGGIGVWTHALATALAREGHELSVITRATDRPRVEFADGIWVHRIVPRDQRGRGVPRLPDLPATVRDYALTAFDEVVRIHSARGLDLVSSPIWDLEGAACLAARLLPTVLSLHSTYAFVLRTTPAWQTNSEYRRHHVDRMIAAELWALEQADLVMANSRAIVTGIEAEYGVGLDRAKIALVPHGMPEPPRVSPRPSDDEGRVRLLYVGRFELRKGIDLLLDVLPDLLLEFPTLEAALVGCNDFPVGDGPIKDRFEARHAGAPFLRRIRFTGVLPDRELAREYARCDLFVAPSRYESFGLIYLEAMRCAKPCIGTRAGGIPEVIRDGVDGLLVPPGDREALADGIRRLVRDPDERRRLGTAARARYLSSFTVEQMATRAAAAYRTLVDRVELPVEIAC